MAGIEINFLLHSASSHPESERPWATVLLCLHRARVTVYDHAILVDFSEDGLVDKDAEDGSARS